MRAIYRKIRHARYLYIKRDVEKAWGARHTLGARYLSKNTVLDFKTFKSFSSLLRVQYSILILISLPVNTEINRKF